MTQVQTTADFDDIDANVDIEIAGCLNLDAPRSFFLFAGAGSGKTRSLVKALKHIQLTMSAQLRAKGQRAAVITYTNAACDEIKRRLRFDPLIDVRTIHSFAWSLIQGFNSDIRDWLQVNLVSEVELLRFDEAKGRKGTKASATRLRKIESKTRRLANLPNIRVFTYSPAGDNHGRDSLSHSEVLQLAAHFLVAKPAMQSILAGRYPILLIDESQDTNKLLIDALFEVECKLKGRFLLGLLGDMMQRIYSDGKDGLGSALPSHWATPTKKLNYRCPRRIIDLINMVRRATDKQIQEPTQSAKDGVIRFFVLPSDLNSKSTTEISIRQYMANLTGDPNWREIDSVKMLTLEHRMAASRMGFLQAFAALYEYEGWRTSFLDGRLPAMRLFSDSVLSLVEARRSNDPFAVARILKASSPRLSQEALRQASDVHAHLKEINASVDALMDLWEEDSDPTLLAILQHVAKHNLFVIPSVLSAHIPGNAVEVSDDQADPQAEQDLAISAFLKSPFSQIKPMAKYLAGDAHFDTHQGVKGLEFDRVMVVMDDSEAKGFTFKYEDLFGGKGAGDKTVESTRRLFYVTASRARESLAMVAYAGSPDRVRNFVLENGWFSHEEVITKMPT